MKVDIQRLLDNCLPDTPVRLAVGEFEGPFYIRKPCTVTGASTTLWAKKGPVLVITSNGVKIKNLRVEITEHSANADDFTCLVSTAADTKYENVEVIGNIKGIRGEEEAWDIPQVIDLGKLPAESRASFVMEVQVPVGVRLKSTIRDISISPEYLMPGRNKITIASEKLKEGTFIYGEILFESMFVRRAYINGAVMPNMSGYVNNRVVYQASSHVPAIMPGSANTVSALNIIAPMVSDPSVSILKRGQRLSINGILEDKIQLNLTWSSMIQQMDIDPYVFMLEKNGKASGDDSLIFFGNPSSGCGGVKCLDDNGDKSILIDLTKISGEISTISVAYSIYGNNPNNNFSKIVDPVIRILSGGREKLRFFAKDLLIETTIVAIEFYRYKNEWKINTVGAGFRDGLKRLCESYGLSVI